MPFDLQLAVRLGKLVDVAYGVPPGVVPVVTGSVDLGDPGLVLLTPLYADDPWDSRTGYVPYGLVARTVPDASGAYTLFVAIRGTENFWDWFKDFEFWRVPCAVPTAPAGAETEDGFTTLYGTLRSTPSQDGDDLVTALGKILSGFPSEACTTIFVTGHSLGGALATLVALDLAVGQPGSARSLYTFASPAVGNGGFASWFGQQVTDAYRIVNAPDLVPGAPPAVFGFEHVGQPYPINSGQTTRPTIECHHSLDTYLAQLDPVNCPVGAACRP